MTIRVLHGDCRDVLPTLAANSVHCCVTSPPYFGLRDYGVAGQLGLEATPDEYIQTMVAVFREVRRVLRDDGTFWVNMGDSYSSGLRTTQCDPSGYTGTATLADGGARRAPAGIAKPKDLLMMPARLALALQADGWWLRSDIIWAKPNPMPESVTDRCVSAHEHIFMLTKAPKYYFDSAAIAEPAEASTVARLAQDVDAQLGSWRANGGAKTNGPMHAVGGATRNCRNVWTLATESFSGSHFATFPTALAERCIKAGCPRDGVVLDPFAGAGTTMLVADRLQRHAIGIELNEAYAMMARNRIMADAPLFAEVAD